MPEPKRVNPVTFLHGGTAIATADPRERNTPKTEEDALDVAFEGDVSDLPGDEGDDENDEPKATLKGFPPAKSVPLPE